MATEDRSGGRTAIAEQERKARGDRMRALREALGYASQEALANASADHVLERIYVNRVETGSNLFTSGPLQRAFAETMGFMVGDLVAYVDGTIDLPTLLILREPTAWDVVEAVEELPGLRTWLSKNRTKLRLSHLVRGLAVYRHNKPSSKHGELVPHGDWGAFFADANSGRVTRARGGDVEGAAAAETSQLSPATRRQMQRAHKKR